jgi:hypothetical protein
VLPKNPCATDVKASEAGHGMKRDEFGRRIFVKEASAFKAQQSAWRNLGVVSGVIDRGDGTFVLLYDPLAGIWETTTKETST